MSIGNCNLQLEIYIFASCYIKIMRHQLGSRFEMTRQN